MRHVLFILKILSQRSVQKKFYILNCNNFFIDTGQECFANIFTESYVYRLIKVIYFYYFINIALQ